MQVTQAADTTTERRVGLEEDIIKFRPSPNFKNMKKFLKNRSDYTESTTLASSNGVPELSTSQKVDQINEVKPVVVQPPLPPYPPPPDSPLDINITIKKEKEDVETPANGDEPEQNPSLEQPPSDSDCQLEERPKKTMCKEFIRGDCKRSVCRFSHEVDISQLRGVFTFCWNYQNAFCTYPNCKFVHATVFEEAEFYRTGMLPPHARAHLRRSLPPPPPSEELQPELHSNFVNPPPTHHSGVDKAMPVISCIPASIIEARSVEELKIPRSNSPLKREWSDIDDFSSSPRDLEPKEHLAKKCKNCDLMEFSLQINKEKVENLMQSSEEINNKLGQLNRKSLKLNTVLLTLMKPAINAKTGVNGLVGGEKDKILERLNNFVSSSNRLSSIINEDSVKKVVSSPPISGTSTSRYQNANTTARPAYQGTGVPGPSGLNLSAAQMQTQPSPAYPPYHAGIPLPVTRPYYSQSYGPGTTYAPVPNMPYGTPPARADAPPSPQVPLRPSTSAVTPNYNQYYNGEVSPSTTVGTILRFNN